jgi:hypothetical protein
MDQAYTDYPGHTTLADAFGMDRSRNEARAAPVDPGWRPCAPEIAQLREELQAAKAA